MKLKGKEGKSIIRKLVFRNFVCLDCDGEGRHRRGGLAMLWSDKMELNLISHSLHHMNFVIVEETSGDNWRLMGM